MTSYSTQELAHLFCVSGQTVRNVARKLNLTYSKIEGSRSFFFEEEQALVLAKYFNTKLPISEETEARANAALEVSETLINALEEQIAFLKSQLQLKDEILLEQSKVIATLASAQDSLSKANVLKEATDNKELLIPDQLQEKKKGFFSRFFKR